MAIAATRTGRRLHERITRELVAQQKLVVQDLDPKVRQGVVDVIRRLARSAEARILCGPDAGCDDASGACGPGSCGPGTGVDG